MAAYEGQERLKKLLSVQATGDAGGDYVLAGLSPCTYNVQAALDDIWLSDTTTITVGDGKLADVDLNIGKPGARSQFC